MTKEGLVDAIATRMGIKMDDARRFLEALTKELLQSSQIHKEISLAPLGKFKVVERPARKCRNPQTGEMMELPARRAIHFMVGKALRDAANRKNAPARPTVGQMLREAAANRK